MFTIHAIRVRTLSTALAVAMAACAGIGTAAAVEISRHQSDGPTINAILLKGEIKSGDTDAVKKYIASLSNKNRVVAYLDSQGGTLREGMALGRFFREAKIATVVQTKTVCAYACALAFLGGHDGAGKANRTKYSSAVLVFSQFGYTFDADQTYTAADMSRYQIVAQSMVYQIATYLGSIGAGRDVLRIMLGPKSADRVSNDTAVGLGIHVYDEGSSRLVDPGQFAKAIKRAGT